MDVDRQSLLLAIGTGEVERAGGCRIVAVRRGGGPVHRGVGDAESTRNRAGERDGKREGSGAGVALGLSDIGDGDRRSSAIAGVGGAVTVEIDPIVLARAQVAAVGGQIAVGILAVVEAGAHVAAVAHAVGVVVSIGG